MSRDQLRAMAMIEGCRTGALGSAVYRCAACGKFHHVPRSCGNRHCPACQGHKARQWLETQLDKLLPSGFQKVRHYGFAHPRRKIDPEWLSMLVTLTLNLFYTLTVRAKPMPVKHTPACPHCGGELKCIAMILASGACVPIPIRDSS